MKLYFESFLNFSNEFSLCVIEMLFHLLKFLLTFLLKLHNDNVFIFEDFFKFLILSWQLINSWFHFLSLIIELISISTLELGSSLSFVFKLIFEHFDSSLVVLNKKSLVFVFLLGSEECLLALIEFEFELLNLNKM